MRNIKNEIFELITVVLSSVISVLILWGGNQIFNPPEVDSPGGYIIAFFFVMSLVFVPCVHLVGFIFRLFDKSDRHNED